MMFWIDRNIFIQRLLSPLNYSLWGVFAKMQNPDGKKLNEGNHAEILRIKNREILAAPEMVISRTRQMRTGVKSLCFLYLELIHIFCGQIENKLPPKNHNHSPEKSLIYNIVDFFILAIVRVSWLRMYEEANEARGYESRAWFDIYHCSVTRW